MSGLRWMRTARWARRWISGGGLIVQGNTRADFGLEDLLDVPVRYLSTGQRKRAALARLAASGAQIWLLDEPLNGLDTHWGASTQAAIEAHRALGGIAVIASHQPLQLHNLRTLSLLDHLA